MPGTSSSSWRRATARAWRKRSSAGWPSFRRSARTCGVGSARAEMPEPVPQQVVAVGNELAIVWEDGREDYLAFERLRRECPRALCGGERGLLGNVYRGPNRPLAERSFQLVSPRPVGGDALQIKGADGHPDGLQRYETLRRMGEET